MALPAPVALDGLPTQTASILRFVAEGVFGSPLIVKDAVVGAAKSTEGNASDAQSIQIACNLFIKTKILGFKKKKF
jgi:hypothetical protein